MVVAKCFYIGFIIWHDIIIVLESAGAGRIIHTTVVLCLKIVSPVSKTCLIFFIWLLELPYCLKCVLKLYEMCI